MSFPCVQLPPHTLCHSSMRAGLGVLERNRTGEVGGVYDVPPSGWLMAGGVAAVAAGCKLCNEQE